MQNVEAVTNVKATAIQTTVCGNISYTCSVKVSDILELVRTPSASDAWSKGIQNESGSAQKKITESHEGLAMYLANNGAATLDPVTIMYKPKKGMFDKKGSAKVGTFSINEDHDPILLNAYQQFNALHIIKSGNAGGDLADEVLNSEIMVSFTPCETEEKSSEIYRFLNREFNHSQSKEFLSTPISVVTNYILKSDLLRSTDGSNTLLVNTKSYSIPARSLMFLTTRAIDSIHESLFKSFPEMSLNDGTIKADEMWTEFMNLDFFHELLKNPRGLREVRDGGAYSALLRSSVQQSVFKAAAELTLEKSDEEESESFEAMSIPDAFKAIFKLNLDISEESIVKTFFDGDRIKTSASDTDLGAKAIINAVRRGDESI